MTTWVNPVEDGEYVEPDYVEDDYVDMTFSIGDTTGTIWVDATEELPSWSNQ